MKRRRMSVSGNPLNIQQIEGTFEEMVRVMERSQREIFKMSEEGRRQYESLKKEWSQLKEEISQRAKERNQLEKEIQKKQQKLVEEPQETNKYSNDAEKEVNERSDSTSHLLLQLSLKQAEEKKMWQRKDNLEYRLKKLLQSVERADQLVHQVSTVLTYLTSDLKHIGEAFREVEEQQQLAIRIIQAQEEERKRLSREIHDGPAQLMANVSLQAGYIEKLYTKDSTLDLRKELKELKKFTRAALKEIRHVIYDLRPMALDDLGLVPTLEKILSEIQKNYPKTRIHYINLGEPSRLESKYEVSLFRLVQESVANSLKHAKASDIWVKTEWVHDKVNVVVKDNGIGFQQSDIGHQNFGIIGMKERVHLLKGEFSICSIPNEGTTIFIQIPLKKRQKMM